MNILLYSFLLIALYHLIYEGILLPSLRLRLRFRLFEIRDRLRDLKNREKDCCSDQAFAYLQDSINNGLGMLHRTDLITLLKVEEQVEQDDVLKRQLARRSEVLSEVVDPDVRAIMRSISHVGRAAVILNSGGWFIYVVPAMLALIAFGRIKAIVKELLVFPEGRIEACQVV